MPVTVNVGKGDISILERVFQHFQEIDERFSTYNSESEISRINRGEIDPSQYSPLMQEVFSLSQETKKETDGYFDIRSLDGSIDPSGLVKGWAISKAAQLIRDLGYVNFWVEAGGDMQVGGHNEEGNPWRVGIRNPFNVNEIVKVIELSNAGIATSGTYIRGEHIYDPHTKSPAPRVLASITVVASDVYDADRFATAAFAMGKRGVEFVAAIKGLEVFAIDFDKRTTSTPGFERITQKSV